MGTAALVADLEEVELLWDLEGDLEDEEDFLLLEAESCFLEEDLGSEEEGEFVSRIIFQWFSRCRPGEDWAGCAPVGFAQRYGCYLSVT